MKYTRDKRGIYIHGIKEKHLKRLKNWLSQTRKLRHDIYEIAMWVGLIGFFIVKALENA